MKRIVIASLFGAAALAAALQTNAAGQQAPASAPKAGYTPVLGEFMLATQTRHAKLWFAGNVQNWDLAEYEIDELKEGLEDVVKNIPVFKDIPIGKMIESTMDSPIANVETAIKAKDRAKFVAAYDKLTEACNSCHQSASRPFIVIQRPATSAFPNQNFNPGRR